MIGTGGTSPMALTVSIRREFALAKRSGRHGKAVKVWDQRQLKNLDDLLEVGTRNIKLALRRLRKFAREGCGDRA